MVDIAFKYKIQTLHSQPLNICLLQLCVFLVEIKLSDQKLQRSRIFILDSKFKSRHDDGQIDHDSITHDLSANRVSVRMRKIIIHAFII